MFNLLSFFLRLDIIKVNIPLETVDADAFCRYKIGGEKWLITAFVHVKLF